MQPHLWALERDACPIPPKEVTLYKRVPGGNNVFKILFLMIDLKYYQVKGGWSFSSDKFFLKHPKSPHITLLIPLFYEFL